MNPIDKLYQLAVSIYTEERVTIYKSKNNELKGAIYIYFPQIKITNTPGNEHDIVDIYVKMEFKDSGKMYGSLYGLRSTVTAFERHNNYLHSHLPSGEPGEWKEFCLGSSSEIATAVANAAYNSANINAELHFEYLLHYLPIFLSWESKEGRPYISIDSFKSPGISDLKTRHLDNFLKNLQYAINEDFYLEVKVRYTTTYPYARVIYNKEFEEFLQGLTEHRVLVNSLGKYINSMDSDDILKGYANDDFKSIRMSDKLIKCRIIHDSNKDGKTQEQYQKRVTKEFRIAAETILGERFSGYIINSQKNVETINERESKSANIGNGIFENLTFV